MTRHIFRVSWASTLLACATMSHAQTPTASTAEVQRDVTAQLVSDRWETKRQAVSRILAMPAQTRPRDLISRVIDEIVAFQQDSSTPEWNPPGLVDHEVAWGLYADLLQIACEAKDERAIPVLVKAVSVGQPVRGALADFGSAAAQPLIDATRATNRPDYSISSLRSLMQMVTRRSSLSPSYIRAIGQLGREHMIGRQHPAVVQVAIEVAAAVKDAESLASLQRLASATSAAAAGLILADAPERFEPLRRRAMFALEAIRTGP